MISESRVTNELSHTITPGYRLDSSQLPCRKQETGRGMVVSSSWKDGVGNLGTPKWLEFIRRSARKERVTKRDSSIDLQKGAHYALSDPRWALTGARMRGNCGRLGRNITGAAVAHPDTHKQPGIVGFSHQPERKKLIIHRHWTERSSQMKTYLQAKKLYEIL